MWPLLFALVAYLVHRFRWNLFTTTILVFDLLHKQSGLLGISELSNDCQEIEEAAGKGHEGAKLALEVFSYRLAKYEAPPPTPERPAGRGSRSSKIGRASCRERV